MKYILFVTENVSKYDEILNYLRSINNSNISIQMIKPDIEIKEIQSLDRNEIIIRKLQDAYSSIKSLINYQHILYNNKPIWIMVEDSALNIDKMGGFPGTFIKYYLQSLSVNNISHANWGSTAISYVTLGITRYVCGLDNNIDNLLSAKVFDGNIEGMITEPRGKNGFGYDSIFRPKGSLKTNAEMTCNEKEKYNPRIIAFSKVIDFLKNI